MNIDYQNINNQTYNKSASELAKYFAGIGSRTDDIERGLTLAEKPTDARVIEIGCGDGRDAVEIAKRVAFYAGFDPSEGLLNIAKRKLSEDVFIKATALSYNYPNNIDVIYAFASLLHVPQRDLPTVFEKVHQSLRPGGIFYISTKESSEYKEEIKQDKFGERMFYFYNAAILRDLADSDFEQVYENHQVMGQNQWLTIAFKKL